MSLYETPRVTGGFPSQGQFASQFLENGILHTTNGKVQMQSPPRMPPKKIPSSQIKQTFGRQWYLLKCVYETLDYYHYYKTTSLLLLSCYLLQYQPQISDRIEFNLHRLFSNDFQSTPTAAFCCQSFLHLFLFVFLRFLPIVHRGILHETGWRCHLVLWVLAVIRWTWRRAVARWAIARGASIPFAIWCLIVISLLESASFPFTLFEIFLGLYLSVGQHVNILLKFSVFFNGRYKFGESGIKVRVYTLI